MDTQYFLPSFEQIASHEEHFMRAALREALKAYEQDEVPVGAVVVLHGEIIARGYNQVETLQDATAHAEMLAITSAAAALGNWRLEKCTLYSTLEPCPMCMGAMILSRLPRLVWGAKDLRHGANGSWVDLTEKKHPIHTVSIESGVLEDFCRRPLQTFFAEKRKKNDLSA